MEYFRRLGADIRARWQKRDFALADFSTIATDALADAWAAGGPPGLDEILHWLWTTDALPEQVDRKSEFGQPPITLYHCPEFYISVLVWHTATTSVHQHGFDGAFSVLHGSSLQGRYHFECTHPIDERIKVGDLRLQRIDVLERGAVEPIRAGSALIHSVFHLEAPSATLVIRNSRSPDCGPQFDYRGAHVALDPFVDDPLLQRRMQCLDTLAALGTDDYPAAASALVSGGDPLTCYRVLEHVGLRSAPDESALAGESPPLRPSATVPRAPLPRALLTEMLRVAGAHHGDWLDKVPPVLDAVRRKRIITSRRALVTDPDHRYLLALLGNLDRRTDILDMVARRAPERDPRETVILWMRAMSGTDIVGLELDEVNEWIVRFLLEDTAPEDIPARLADVYDPADIAEQRAELAAHIQRIRSADVFQTLLGDQP